MLSRWTNKITWHKKPAEGGFLLPAVIALGIGISTASVLALQTVANNSQNLNTQQYKIMAREAAQAGAAQARACATALSTPIVVNDTRCEVASPSQPIIYDASGGVVIQSTFTTSRPALLSSLTPSTLVITVTGVAQVGGVTVASETVQTILRPGNPGSPGGGTVSKSVQSISAGPETVCAVAVETATTSKAHCWGSNANGLLGTGYNYNGGSGGFSRVPVALAQGTQPAQTNNSSNRCGSGFVSCASNPGTSAIPTSASVTKISVGTDHACAIASEKAYCWGDNGSGQLGRGGFGLSVDLPVAVATSGGGNLAPTDRVLDISAGKEFTCAIATSSATATEGRVLCWGRNDHGQLGDDSRSTRSRPVNVSTSTSTSRPCVRNSGWSCTHYMNIVASALSGKMVSKLATLKGAATMCAITGASDGNRAVCWGQNVGGQTGNDYEPAAYSFSDTLRHSNQNQCDRIRPDLGERMLNSALPDNFDMLRPVAVESTERFEEIIVGNEVVTPDNFGSGVDFGDGHNNGSTYFNAGSFSRYVTALTSATSAHPNRYTYWGSTISFDGEMSCRRNSTGGGQSSGWSQAEGTVNISFSRRAPNTGNTGSAISLISEQNGTGGISCREETPSATVSCNRGNGSSAHPSGIIPVTGNALALDTGDSSYTCSILQTGSIRGSYCWGNNARGQLGNDSTATNSLTPVATGVTANSSMGTSTPSIPATPLTTILKGF